MTPLRRARSAFASPLPETFTNKTRNKRKCSAFADFVNPLALLPPCSRIPREGFNRKRLASVSHRRPLFSSWSPPSCPGRPSREPLQKGQAQCLQTADQPVERASTGKGNPPGRGLGHSCHRRVLGGFRGRGVLRLTRPRGGQPSPTAPIWKADGFDLKLLGTT